MSTGHIAVQDFLKEGLSSQDCYLFAVKLRALSIALSIEDQATKATTVEAILKSRPFGIWPTPAQQFQDDTEMDLPPGQVGTGITQREVNVETYHYNQYATPEQNVDNYLNLINTHYSFFNPITFFLIPMANSGFFSSNYHHFKINALCQAAEIAYCCKRDNLNATTISYDYYARLSDSKLTAVSKSVTYSAMQLIGVAFVYAVLLSLLSTMGIAFGVDEFRNIETASAITAGVVVAIFAYCQYLTHKTVGTSMLKEWFVKPFKIAEKVEINHNKQNSSTRAGWFSAYIRNDENAFDDPAKTALQEARNRIEGREEATGARAPLLTGPQNA